MPFTPFHWGFSILIQSIFIFLDPVALFIGSVIPDIEGITALFIIRESDLPLHGSLHSFMGALFLGILTGIFSWLSNRYFFRIFIRDYLNQDNIPEYRLYISLLSSFIGTFSHIILDAPLYSEMELYYPYSLGNPFYNYISGSFVYFFCIISFIGGFSIIIIRFKKGKTKN